MSFLGKIFGGKGNGSKKPDSCMPEYNVTDEPMRPLSAVKGGALAIKVIAATNLRSSKETAKIVMSVQEEIAAQAKKGHIRVVVSVEAFLDGCKHATPWSSKPADVGSASTRWHCYQSETMFVDSFADLASEKVDVVIIVGNRFDDDLYDAVIAAKRLHKSCGTKLFAVPTTSDVFVNESYKKIANEAGGLSLPCLVDDGDDYDYECGEIMREIMQLTLLRKTGNSLDALPDPKSKGAKEIRGFLEREMP